MHALGKYLWILVPILMNVPSLQGLLKKHEAFETDFTVHKDRVNDVCANGEDLIKKVSGTQGQFCSIADFPPTHSLSSAQD